MKHLTIHLQIIACWNTSYLEWSSKSYRLYVRLCSTRRAHDEYQNTTAQKVFQSSTTHCRYIVRILHGMAILFHEVRTCFYFKMFSIFIKDRSLAISLLKPAIRGLKLDSTFLKLVLFLVHIVDCVFVAQRYKNI